MRIPRLPCLFIALALPSAAFGQSAILQGGAWTPGRAPMYVGQGSSQPVVQDSGPASGGASGLGLKELLLIARGTGTAPYAGQGTGPYGTISCQYDAPTTNSTGYHYLCSSPNAQGGGLIAYGNGGTASALPFSFIINGSTYQFPFSTSGVVGPSSSVIGDIAVWNNTSGTLLKDVSFVTLCGDHPFTSLLTGCVPASGGGTSNFLRADGSWATPSVSGLTINSTTISGSTPYGLLYANGGVLGNLATAANGFLVTDGSGVPSISSTLPSGLTIPSPTITGTLGGSLVIPTAALQNAAVSNAKLASMTQSTIKGRAASAGTGDPTDLTATQATAILNAFVGDSGSGGTKGLVPAPASGDAAANKFLKADGAWTAIAATGTVTSVSVTTANGVSGSVATATTTPAITLTLGAITPSSVVASGNITGAALIPSGASIPTNGFYLPTSNTLGVSLNSTNVATWNSTGLGFKTTPAAPIHLNCNTVTTINDPPVNIGFWITAKDGGGAGGCEKIQINTYAIESGFLSSRANGTAASKTGLLSNDVIVHFGGLGYDGTAYTSSNTTTAKMEVKATENWSVTNHGTEITFETTPNGSTTRALVGRWTNDGKLQAINSVLSPLYVGGTAASSSLTLQSTSGVGTTDQILFKVGNNGATNALTIDNSGKVIFSVGTTTPDASILSSNLQMLGTNLATTSPLLSRNSADANSSIVTMYKSRNATIGSHTVVQSGDFLGRMQGWGDDGTNPIQAAQISFDVDGTPGTNDMPGRIIFSTTADGAAVITEHMRLDWKGHLGYSGTAPVISGCGTSPSTARGTDTAGEVTEGTTATGCVITFANSGYTAAPYCTVTSQTQFVAFAYSISTTAITVTNTSASGVKLNWTCFGT